MEQILPLTAPSSLVQDIHTFVESLPSCFKMPKHLFVQYVMPRLPRCHGATRFARPFYQELLLFFLLSPSGEQAIHLKYADISGHWILPPLLLRARSTDLVCILLRLPFTGLAGLFDFVRRAASAWRWLMTGASSPTGRGPGVAVFLLACGEGPLPPRTKTVPGRVIVVS